MIKMASFRAVKHPYLRLKTSKLKIVESFENFGKNVIDEELFTVVFFEDFFGDSAD